MESQVRKFMLKTALRFSHELLEEVIELGDTVVDATMGNGNDTLFLAKLVGETGLVYGFDVQEQALENTTERLEKENSFSQAKLLLQGHETIEITLLPDEKVKAAVFNLGYLPKGDKSVVTNELTTIRALEALLLRLEKSGRIVLVIYDGHDEGKIEKEEILNFVSKIEQEKFSVLNYHFINQRNNPPSLICIERKNSD